MSLLLVDDREMQTLNYDYRGYDKPTDVLSFALQDSVEGTPALFQAEGMPDILGDVVISVETAIRQAETHSLTLDDELALLGVHGVLHLLGYEDETVEGSAEMRKREQAILGTSFPVPPDEGQG